MDDKMLESALKNALEAPDLPRNLNARLMDKINKKQRKSALIFSITKKCSSCAAVFLCALTVLSNSGGEMQQLLGRIPVIGSVSERLTFRRSEELPDTSAKKTRPAETKQDIQKDTAEAAGNAAADSAQPESGASAESIAQPPVKSETDAAHAQKPRTDTAAKHKEAADVRQASPVQPESASQEASTIQPESGLQDIQSDENIPQQQSAVPNAETFSKENSAISAFSLDAGDASADKESAADSGENFMTKATEVSGGGSANTRMMRKSALGSLFDEDYDYISAANEIIRSQLPDDTKFSGINGSEDFHFSDGGDLIIAVTLPDTDESREFNLGKIVNGRFAE
mgnify:CR=1 FL=1